MHFCDYRYDQHTAAQPLLPLLPLLPFILSFEIKSIRRERTRAQSYAQTGRPWLAASDLTKPRVMTVHFCSTVQVGLELLCQTDYNDAEGQGICES